jgi:hypothetical protein
VRILTDGVHFGARARSASYNNVDGYGSQVGIIRSLLAFRIRAQVLIEYSTEFRFACFVTKCSDPGNALVPRRSLFAGTQAVPMYFSFGLEGNYFLKERLPRSRLLTWAAVAVK